MIMDASGTEIVDRPKFSVYLDYKYKLSVAQIAVNLPPKYRLSGDFKVCKKGLEIEENGVKTYIHFKGLKLAPTSCHNMQWTGPGELQMRVQAYKWDNSEKSRRRERILSGDYGEPDLANGRTFSSSSSETDTDGFAPAFPKVKVTCPVWTESDTVIRCSQCGEIVVKARRFTRVLPLPSNNWQELTDSWFCCKHNQGAGVGRPQRLVPKTDDCLYSDSCLVVASSVLHSPGVTTSKADVLQCFRCRNVLGETTKQENGSSMDEVPAVLYRYQVTIGEPQLTHRVDKHVWLAEFEKGMSTMLLHQAEQLNCFRYVIESKTGAKSSSPFMLIWLMDVNSVMYKGSAVIGQDSPEDLTPKSVAKVIYKDCLKDTSLSSQWRKDLGAQCITLPELQCTQLLQLLSERTQLLPPSLRTADQFYISYLETSVSCPL